MTLVAYPAPPPPRVVLADFETWVVPENLVCGVAASFHNWEPRQFGAFLRWVGGGRDGAPPPALRLDHRAHRFLPSGVMSADVGACLDWASVPASGDFPGGLVVLAALHPEYAPAILAGMRHSGGWTAMSVGGVKEGFPDQPAATDLWIHEVSLCRRGQQADEGALVLGTGPRAGAIWELLSGEPVGVT
jgi:hypothetical protein